MCVQTHCSEKAEPTFAASQKHRAGSRSWWQTLAHISSHFLGRPRLAGALQVLHTRTGEPGNSPTHLSVQWLVSRETAIGCWGPERHQSYCAGVARRLEETQRGAGRPARRRQLWRPALPPLGPWVKDLSCLAFPACLVCTWCPPAPAPWKRRFFKLRQMWQSAGSAGVSFVLIMSLVWTDLRKWDYVFPFCSFIQLFVYLFAHLEVGCHRELAWCLSCFHTHFISVPEDLRPQRETSQISSQKA